MWERRGRTRTGRTGGGRCDDRPALRHPCWLFGGHGVLHHRMDCADIGVGAGLLDSDRGALSPRARRPVSKLPSPAVAVCRGRILVGERDAIADGHVQRGGRELHVLDLHGMVGGQRGPTSRVERAAAASEVARMCMGRSSTMLGKRSPTGRSSGAPGPRRCCGGLDWRRLAGGAGDEPVEAGDGTRKAR